MHTLSVSQMGVGRMRILVVGQQLPRVALAAAVLLGATGVSVNTSSATVSWSGANATYRQAHVIQPGSRGTVVDV
jgi:hypothetical protein